MKTLLLHPTTARIVVLNLAITFGVLFPCAESLLISNAQTNVRGISAELGEKACSNIEDTATSINTRSLTALKNAKGTQTPMSTQNRWAILMGVDIYFDKRMQLLGAWNDSLALNQTFEQYGYFKTFKVGNATGQHMLSTLDDMKKYSLVEQPDILLLSFSGHGFTHKGKSYLLPVDAKGSVNDLLKSAISVSEITNLIKSVKPKQVIMLLDVCLVDVEGDSLKQVGQMEIDLSDLKDVNMVTIYATQPGQPSYENTSKQMGYFTSAVVNGLNGSAANVKGEVTLSGLFSYLSKVVPQEVCRTVKARQIPFVKIEGNAIDLIITAVQPMID